jgi:hypothetical protein
VCVCAHVCGYIYIYIYVCVCLCLCLCVCVVLYVLCFVVYVFFSRSLLGQVPTQPFFHSLTHSLSTMGTPSKQTAALAQQQWLQQERLAELVRVCVARTLSAEAAVAEAEQAAADQAAAQLALNERAAAEQAAGSSRQRKRPRTCFEPFPPQIVDLEAKALPTAEVLPTDEALPIGDEAEVPPAGSSDSEGSGLETIKKKLAALKALRERRAMIADKKLDHPSMMPAPEDRPSRVSPISDCTESPPASPVKEEFSYFG